MRICLPARHPFFIIVVRALPSARAASDTPRLMRFSDGCEVCCWRSLSLTCAKMLQRGARARDIRFRRRYGAESPICLTTAPARSDRMRLRPPRFTPVMFSVTFARGMSRFVARRDARCAFILSRAATFAYRCADDAALITTRRRHVATQRRHD